MRELPTRSKLLIVLLPFCPQFYYLTFQQRTPIESKKRPQRKKRRPRTRRKMPVLAPGAPVLWRRSVVLPSMMKSIMAASASLLSRFHCSTFLGTLRSQAPPVSMDRDRLSPDPLIFYHLLLAFSKCKPHIVYTGICGRSPQIPV